MLDIESNNEKALLLMKQITDAMRKTETTVAKEKVHLLWVFFFSFLFFLIEFFFSIIQYTMQIYSLHIKGITNWECILFLAD